MGKTIIRNPLIAEPWVPSITRSGGADIEELSGYKIGNIYILFYSVKTSSTYSIGSNAFTGKLNDIVPKIECTGCGYSSGACIVSYIDTSGNITMRVTGQVLSSNVSATGYIIIIT